jgi:protoheme IX farnesyltransferase
VRITVLGVKSVAGREIYLTREWADLFFHLGKIKISLLAAFSTATGYLLATGTTTIHVLVPTAAVFLLACGSCALNQYQEREIDRWMERTKSRPIPSGRLSPETALWISIGLILSGALILLFGAGDLTLALGLLAVFWYNWIYTPLKQKTAFAAVPGALVGVIPPALGWVAGGGRILDPRIAGVALFFFIWQIPHFWLLLLNVSKDYENVGLPSITNTFSPGQMRRIIFIWLLSVGVSSLAIPLFGLLNSSLSSLFLTAAACWIFLNAISFVRADIRENSPRRIFARLNLFALFVLILLSLDKMFAC